MSDINEYEKIFDACEFSGDKIERLQGIIRAKDYDYHRACDERDQAIARAVAAEADADRLAEALTDVALGPAWGDSLIDTLAHYRTVAVTALEAHNKLKAERGT